MLPITVCRSCTFQRIVLSASLIWLLLLRLLLHLPVGHHRRRKMRGRNTSIGYRSKQQKQQRLSTSTNGRGSTNEEIPLHDRNYMARRSLIGDWRFLWQLITTGRRLRLFVVCWVLFDHLSVADVPIYKVRGAILITNYS